MTQAVELVEGRVHRDEAVREPGERSIEVVENARYVRTAKRADVRIVPLQPLETHGAHGFEAS
eukprot:8526502-Pyramimonas_sp.AAC.1